MMVQCVTSFAVTRKARCPLQSCLSGSGEDNHVPHQPGHETSGSVCVPVTVSFPDECMPSPLKEMSPASSRVTEESVSECFFPWTSILIFGAGFSRTPSFCQVPSTSSCDTSTSKVTVPFSQTWRG